MLSEKACEKVILENRNIFDDIIDRAKSCKNVEGEIIWNLQNTGSRWALELEDIYYANSTDDNYGDVVGAFTDCALNMWKKGVIGN